MTTIVALSEGLISNFKEIWIRPLSGSHKASTHLETPRSVAFHIQFVSFCICETMNERTNEHRVSYDAHISFPSSFHLL